MKTKKIVQFTGLVALIVLVSAFSASVGKSKYKCLLQMTNYSGLPAYVVVSVIDADGKYVETVRIQGKDEEWYHDFNTWFGFFEANKEEMFSNDKLDAISGASIAGGERSIFALKLNEDWFGRGYILRFESAVENQKYLDREIEVQLNTEFVGQHKGSEYIRYVKIAGQ